MKDGIFLVSRSYTKPLVLLGVCSLMSLTACGSGSSSDADSAVSSTSELTADSSPTPASGPINDESNLPPPSTEGGQQGVFNPNADSDVFACEARYYTELRGSYSGILTYTSPTNPAETCSWTANLQIRGTNAGSGDTSTCNVSANYSYSLLEGSANCIDGSLDAELIDPLQDRSNIAIWESPDWPYDLPMALEAGIGDSDIIPAGTIDAAVRDITWRLDGFDTAFIIDNNAADGTVEGALVKR